VELPATSVADLVEAAAARYPDAPAVVAGETSLTYGELDARANRLVAHLQGMGVGPDGLVGVCLGRSVDLAVALIAVLKAGGACVPLDPAYPGDRLAWMADDASLVAVVTRSGLVDRLPGVTAPLIRVDVDAAGWAGTAVTAPVRTSSPEDLGYVIYTSGSTGRPKGVMLTNRGLVNHHRAVVELYGLGPGDRVLQFCSIGFDASVEEMFPTWAAGATVVFRPDDAPLLGRGWLAWLRRQRITVLNLPTAYWQAWVADVDALGEPVPDDLRLVVVGGEKARGPVYATWRRVSAGRSRWVNAYGPTETTCMSTWYEPGPGDEPGDERDPPIGRPLPATTTAVVDHALRPVPAGVTGELLLGGAGLARGYLHDPALTAQRFVAGPDDGSSAGPRRVYRTGDLVRELPDGNLDYVGRMDDQVKIRGFRIELGEVEAALARHPAVAAAAVVARDEPPGDRHLVGYVTGTASGAPTGGELRRYLSGRLPPHLVPSAFMVLDALPLTSNGKVDRTALPAPDRGPARSAPSGRSPAEDRMAAIWAGVLKLDVDELGPDDDFFDLGGHSLLATQVMAQVREAFATETPLRAIFEVPTLGGLAALVEAEDAGAAAIPLLPGHRPPGIPLPLSLAQEQMWTLEQAADPPGLFNVTALHSFGQPVDVDALARALAYLMDRHEILRTGFGTDPDSRPHQFVAPSATVPIAVVDLERQPAADRDADLGRRIAEQDAAPFDPATPPLWRVGLFRFDAGTARLAVTMDHLICDGTAASVVVHELVDAYAATATGEAPSLPPLPVQFGDFALWQRAVVTEDVLRRQLAWWAGVLDGMPLGPAVPFDHLPVAPTRRIASTTLAVEAGARARLDELARTTGSSTFTVAVAAVAALLGGHGSTTDVVMSTTLSGRTRAEVEDLVGMFSGISRLRTDLSGDPPFAALVERARDRVLGMFENQDVPFMRVRRALIPDFPGEGGLALAAVLPVEFQYFHVRHDQELYFRGQLHPLSVTLLDDGTRITGRISYKLDFYERATVDRLAGDLERLLDLVGTDPSVPLSALPLNPRAQR